MLAFSAGSTPPLAVGEDEALPGELGACLEGRRHWSTLFSYPVPLQRYETRRRPV